MKKTVRILIVATSLHGGGAEFVARTWAGWLSSAGYEVHFAVTGDDAGNGFLPPGCSLHSLASDSGLLKKIRSLRSIVRSSRIEVVLSLQTYPNLLTLALAKSMSAKHRPIVLISERNLVSLGMKGAGVAHKVKIGLARRFYRKADEAVAISHPVAAELVSWFGVRADRCTVVPNPATAKRPQSDAPRQLLDRERPIHLILPGRLVRQKQPELAIQTAAELSERGYVVDVVSFGEGPLLSSTRAHAESSAVSFTSRGWVEDWSGAVPDNSIILLPSSREGFGNVLVEAANAGLPSVALSSALGVADAIVPGITGELALFGTAASVADAIERCFDHRGVDTRNWLARFSADSSGTALEQVIGRALDRTSSR